MKSTVVALLVLCSLLSGCTSLVGEVKDYDAELPPGQGILVISVLTAQPLAGLRVMRTSDGAEEVATHQLPAGRSIRFITLPAGEYEWDQADLSINPVSFSWVPLNQTEGQHYSFTVKPGVVNYPGDFMVWAFAPGELTLTGAEWPGAEVDANTRYYFRMMDRSALLLEGLTPDQYRAVRKLGLVYTGPGSDDYPAYYKSLGGAPSTLTSSQPAAAYVDTGSVPLQDFLRQPVFTSAALSPDGKLVLGVNHPNDYVSNLMLIDLGKRTMATVFNMQHAGYEYPGLRWVSDDTAVFNSADWAERQDLVAFRWGRKPDGTPDAQVKQWGGKLWLLDPRLKGGPQMLLGEQYGTPDDPAACLLKAKVDPGPALLAFQPCDSPLPSDTVDGLTDEQGNMRLQVERDHDGAVHYLYYPRDGKTSADWKDFKVIKDPKAVFRPVAFAPEGDHLFVLSNQGRDNVGFFEYDPATDKMVRTVFAQDGASVTGWHDDPLTHQPAYLTWYAGATPHYLVLEDRARAVMPMLAKAFPGQQAIPWEISDDGGVILAFVYDDTHPGSFYAFDVKAGKPLFLGARMPWIDPAKMAPVKAGTLKTADGFTLSYLLTLPRDGHGPYPLVVIPHGGPIGVFDAQGFDPEAQLLANRGYAVLKVNYRGSGGSGDKFEEAGKRQWGRKIEDDIAETVHLVLRSEPLDADRICIYGASYGGYSALMSVIRDPQLYKCAASLAGLSDLNLLADNTDVKFYKPVRDDMADIIGDPTTDAEQLHAVSPVYLADKITRPVFIAHGMDDPRSDLEQAYRMKTVLEALHKDITFKVYAGMGHGFTKTADALDFYQRLLAFLDKNIGKAPAASPKP